MKEAKLGTKSFAIYNQPAPKSGMALAWDGAVQHRHLDSNSFSNFPGSICFTYNELSRGLEETKLRFTFSKDRLFALGKKEFFSVVFLSPSALTPIKF